MVDQSCLWQGESGAFTLSINCSIRLLSVSDTCNLKQTHKECEFLFSRGAGTLIRQAEKLLYHPSSLTKRMLQNVFLRFPDMVCVALLLFAHWIHLWGECTNRTVTPTNNRIIKLMIITCYLQFNVYSQQGSGGLNPYPEICIQKWMVMKRTLIEYCVLPKCHQVYSSNIKRNIFSSKQKKSNITTGCSCFTWFLFVQFLFNATWKSNHFSIYTIIFGLMRFGKDDPWPCLSSIGG